ncbi:MAG: DUF4838 domain-containing protein [Verrucomicrobiota bacterium]
MLFLILLPPGPAPAAVIAKNGAARAVIVIDPGATATEAFAARQLASCLNQITGATFEVRSATRAPSHSIIVGPGAAARASFPEAPIGDLGGEEFILRGKAGRLLLAGGRPRGTLYAVSRFLQDNCGVRWWTPWASRIPRHPTLRIANLNVRVKPAFEYRDPYWFDAFDADWSWRNCCNGPSSKLPEDEGGCVHYKGFVHTFYPLVPPALYFSAHPEWFSLVNGARSTKQAQLCLSNPQLRDFVVERVKQWLRESPDATIVSVSQNDCFGACECAECRKAAETDGSPAGPLLEFVNYIAEKIEPDFPNVAVDTLAYQYTRKPPRTPRPRPNVIVRLCSIEANFRQPLDSPSNAAFADDLRAWAERADRLYVWDYVTDFPNYVQPHPNWFNLGPNLRFFQSHHVRGVFEEGAYQSHGSEMAELRAWVLAQLLWNPRQDDRALIREFLEGYYGPAAKPIEDYMQLLWDASQGCNLTCWSPPDAPFLGFKTLAAAEDLWQKAEQSVAGDDDLLARVRLARLPVRYVWLARWDSLRKECLVASAKWPLDDSRRQVAAQWRAVAAGVPGKPWTKVTVLSEGGLTPETFLSGVF